LKKLAILIGAIALVATACSSSSDPTTTTAPDAGGGGGEMTAQSGGVLIVDQGAEPTSIDPNRFGSTNDRNIITNMYDTLVEFDLETYEIVPSLATDWSPSADGLTWTFNLREGVTFHDGTTFGAEDVVKSMERAQDPEAGRTTSLLTRVTDTVAVDENTVEIHLSEPDRILLSTLVDVYISPSEDNDLAANPVGTGPFKFVSWEPNQQVEIERNPDYWQEGLPYLDGVIYRTVPDGTVQGLQIRTGDADMLSDTPLGEIGGLQQAGLQIIAPAEGFNSGIYHFHLNTRHEPWTDQSMRQAVSMAIDRQALAASLFGFMTVLSNPMEINSTFFNADAPSYNTRDLEGAKALIGPDRVDGGEMIVCGLGFQYETLAQAVQSQLAEAGIDITITVLDVGTYVAKTFGDDTGNFDLSLCAMVPKPDEYDLLNHPYSKLFKEALGWYEENPGFYSELDAARSLASDDDYKASIKSLQQQAMEGQPEIVLGGRLSPVTAGANVHGFIAHTQGHLFLTNVWMDQ
jgi:peptide/nickel transport system substrate-binding protein/oligopeptide transport system substrate-binding protein